MRLFQTAEPSRGRPLIAVLAIASLLAACGGAATPSPSTSASVAPPASASAGTSTEPSVAPSGDPTLPPAGDAVVVGNGKKQFAWASGLNENSIIAAMQREMKTYAGSKGWEVLFDNGTNSDIQPMVTAVQTWITAGVPSITVIPFQPSAFVPLANQAIDGGLIWVSYGQTMDPKHAQIAFPPCDAAVLVADAAVAWINANNPTAKVLITSSPKIPEVACKWEGAEKAIKDNTKATIVGIQEGTNQVQGLQVTQAALQANPDLRVVIATNDDAAVGAAQAFKAAGVNPDEVFIVGYDGLKEALEQILAGGYIKADAALNLKRLADNVVDTNISLATNGQPAAPITVVEPPVLVTKDDAETINTILSFYE